MPHGSPNNNRGKKAIPRCDNCGAYSESVTKQKSGALAGVETCTGCDDRLVNAKAWKAKISGGSVEA